MKFRLYESSGFVADCPPFAEADDFDALRLWAVDHNDWKGIRQAAVIASATGQFWYVNRDGSARLASEQRGESGGRSQAQKFAERIGGVRPFTPKSASDLGYEFPPPERWRHTTIQVPPLERPKLRWFSLATGQRARRGFDSEVYAEIEDGTGRYERRRGVSEFTAVFVDADGVEEIVPLEGSTDPASEVSEHAAYRAHVSHYYGMGDRRRSPGAAIPPGMADVEDVVATLAHPRGFVARMTAAERRVIEQHAVSVATAHFESLGYAVEDVGGSESYDLRATRAHEIVVVEVKGTTTDGSDIVLTRNEVQLHKRTYPFNALAIVHAIRLTRTESDVAIPCGGELTVEMPWALDEDRLTPLAYSYRTGL